MVRLFLFVNFFRRFYRKSRSKVYTLTLSALRWVTTQLDLTVLQFISAVFKLYNATKNLIGAFL